MIAPDQSLKQKSTTLQKTTLWPIISRFCWNSLLSLVSFFWYSGSMNQISPDRTAYQVWLVFLAGDEISRKAILWFQLSERLIMIPQKQTTLHWNYFIALENDISHFSRFLEIAASNFSSYSIELGRILFAAVSEIEIVASKYCHQLEQNFTQDNINNFRTIITKHHPEFYSINVHLPRFGLTLTPWTKWRSETQPIWWRAYTKVKYERHEHFAEANLKNALNAAAALYVLLLFLYRKEAESGELSPNTQLFLIGEPFVVDTPGCGRERTPGCKYVPSSAKDAVWR